ncbi:MULTISPECIES: aldose epimerase family protein [unclassified Yoonia]|uniref:aldose epimerase family protein n=1 Tax=unclassified Yoonia TaxID=2629118 RepID=UPI002AFF4FAE|nr:MULTISPECIES: aldose epimerase family protein [unclassified Yoonia]
MQVFGTTKDGKEVHAIKLEAGDLTVTLLTYGARLQDVRLTGVDHSLTIGSDDLADYEGELLYHGALVGPIANRIGNARIRLDGMMYELERNEDGQRHLHSGAEGLHAQVWDVVAVTDTAATLALDLPDGMAGLPGKRRVTAEFTLTAPATLNLKITATSDVASVMNIANHSYWNLDGTPNWHGHRMKIAADHYLPIDAATCPTGDVTDVSGTDMDFRDGPVLGPQTPALDHNFCLSEGLEAPRDVLWLTGQSGVSMVMATNMPGMQVFDGRPTHGALALEAQHWPDAPNHAHFPQIKIAAGETYEQITSWRFAP